MLSIGNKTFMNLQEAVGWLLENNALPFQSTANYAGGVEIAMSTLINPSPAKVRVGSIIFFADSKVSTVVGVTSNSFIVSDQYNDLVDDVVYVSNVAINASGHLITTLSNDNTIDAGIIKQITSLSIDASQHLIANYNDGTTTDLGAIFSGNVNIAGNLTADSIIENMSGYSFTASSLADYTLDLAYVGAVKNGNKVTFAIAGNITTPAVIGSTAVDIGYFEIPNEVATKLVNTAVGGGNVLAVNSVVFVPSYDGITNAKTVNMVSYKATPQRIAIRFYRPDTQIEANKIYFFRYESTFLLGNNLVS